MSSPQVEPHGFERRGWRWWVCNHCYHPQSEHPIPAWTMARPLGDNRTWEDRRNDEVTYGSNY